MRFLVFWDIDDFVLKLRSELEARIQKKNDLGGLRLPTFPGSWGEPWPLADSAFFIKICPLLRVKIDKSGIYLIPLFLTSSLFLFWCKVF